MSVRGVSARTGHVWMSREGAREKPDEAAMGDRAVGTGGMRIMLAAVAIADLPDVQCVLDNDDAQAAARWLSFTSRVSAFRVDELT